MLATVGYKRSCTTLYDTHNRFLPHRQAILLGAVEGAHSARVRQAGGIALAEQIAADVALESCKSKNP